MPGSRVIHAQVLSLPARWHMDRHDHPHEELEIILDGRMETLIDGRRIISGPGSFKRHPAHMGHAERLLDGRPLKMLFVCTEVADPAKRIRLPIDLPDRGGRIAAALAWMVDLFQTRGRGYRPTADHLMAALDDLLVQAVEGEGELSRTVRTYATERLAERITLDDLAAAARLSRFHFLRRFRAEAGCTPMRFVARLRLDAARSLHEATDMPLRAIAPLVGLGDGDRLSRLLGRSRPS